MRKVFWFVVLILSIIVTGGYLIFIRPVSSEIHFSYKTEIVQYGNNKIEFYLVNDNPESGRNNYFFRVSVDVTSELITTCVLGDYDWEIRRRPDSPLLFSSATKSGILDKEGYFENKIEDQVFKGISGQGLGEHDVEVILTFRLENGCGVDIHDRVISKTMRLNRKRNTLWRRMMSV